MTVGDGRPPATTDGRQWDGDRRSRLRHGCRFPGHVLPSVARERQALALSRIRNAGVWRPVTPFRPNGPTPARGFGIERGGLRQRERRDDTLGSTRQSKRTYAGETLSTARLSSRRGAPRDNRGTTRRREAPLAPGAPPQKVMGRRPTWTLYEPSSAWLRLHARDIQDGD